MNEISSISEEVIEKFKMGSLRIPVNIQWGFRFFKIIKPYVVLSPYVGCALFSNQADFGSQVWAEDVLNRLEYGIGAGVGLNIWKLQLSFKWNWNLNPIFENNTVNVQETVKSMNMNGGELSLAILF